MESISKMGFELGKWFLQVHCADERGVKILNWRLQRDQVGRYSRTCLAVGLR